MARTLHRLKAKQIDSLGAGRYADGGGLYLDRDAQGRCRWLFMWSRDGRRREMGLGPAGQGGVTLAQARERAGAAREAVREGRDPIEERRAARVPPAPVPRFGHVADEFVASLSPQWRNEKHRAQWSMTLKVYAALRRRTLIQMSFQQRRGRGPTVGPAAHFSDWLNADIRNVCMRHASRPGLESHWIARSVSATRGLPLTDPLVSGAAFGWPLETGRDHPGSGP